MSKAIAADPVCSTNPSLNVAFTAPSKTTSVPGDPVCRTVVGGDQTTVPSPSN